MQGDVCLLPLYQLKSALLILYYLIVLGEDKLILLKLCLIYLAY